MLFTNIVCLLLKRIGRFNNIYVPPYRWVYLKWWVLFNNMVCILLKRMGYFEFTDVYGVTYILLKTSLITPISTMAGCFLIIYVILKSIVQSCKLV